VVLCDACGLPSLKPTSRRSSHYSSHGRRGPHRVCLLSDSCAPKRRPTQYRAKIGEQYLYGFKGARSAPDARGSEPGQGATTQEMRQAPHCDGRPPKYIKVWAARHDGGLDFNIKQAVVDVARHDRPWDTTEVRHVLRTCLTFLGTSLLAYTIDGWGVPEPRHDLFRWVQPWPSTFDVTFPPVVTASDQDILIAVVRQPNLELQHCPGSYATRTVRSSADVTTTWAHIAQRVREFYAPRSSVLWDMRGEGRLSAHRPSWLDCM
jgi:hypothetical protein